MGMFDDLIPAAPPQAPVAPAAQPQARGLFDDLIPDSGPGSTALAGTTPAQNGQPARVMIDTAPRSQQDANFRQVQSGVQGTGRGLADFAGAPVDLMSGAVNLATRGINAASSGLNSVIGTPEVDIPLIDKPFLGSEYIAEQASKVATAAGVPVITPENTKEKLAYNVNRLGANAATTMGALTGLSKAVAPAVTVDGEAISGVNRFVKPYLDHGKTTVAGDVAASAGGGAAQTALDAALPEYMKTGTYAPLLEWAAVAAGGMGGATAAHLVPSAGRGLKNAGERMTGLNRESSPDVPLNPVTGQRYTKAEVDTVAEIAQNLIVRNRPEVAERLMEERNWFRAEGAPMPAIGGLSGDPGLVALEKAARSGPDGPKFTDLDQRLNTEARDRAITIAPRDADSEAFPRKVRQYGDEQIAGAQDRVDQAQTYVDRTQRVRAESEAPNAGQEIRDAQYRSAPASTALNREIIGQGLDPDTAQKNRNYAAIPRTEAPSRPLYDAAQAVRAQAEGVPEPIRGRILPNDTLTALESYAIRDPETGEITGFRPTTYADVERLRPIISSELNNARKNGAPPPLLDSLEQLKRTISDYSQGTPQGQRANEFYQDDYAPKWGNQSGPAGEFRRDHNRNKVVPEKTAERFIQPESPTKTASLQRIIADMPDPAAAQTAAREYLMADLYRAGGVDKATGIVNPQKVRQWAGKNADNLALAPNMRRDVDQVIARAQKGETVAGRFGDELRAAGRNLRATQADVENTFGTTARSSPEKAAASILADDNSSVAMQRTLEALGDDPQAVAGLKAAIRDHILGKKTTANIGKTIDESDPFSFAKLHNLLKDNYDELASVFSPSEMHSLRVAHKFLEPMAIRENTPVSPGSTLFRSMPEGGEEFSKLFRAGLIAHYGALKAGGIMKSLKLALETLPNNRASLEALGKQMMRDPKLAAHLLTREVSTVGSPAWTSKLFNLMGAEAAARNENGDD